MKSNKKLKETPAEQPDIATVLQSSRKKGGKCKLCLLLLLLCCAAGAFFFFQQKKPEGGGPKMSFKTEPVTIDNLVVTVTATDQGGLATAQAFDIAVLDVNEAPTDITLDNTTVAENADGAVVGSAAVLGGTPGAGRGAVAGARPVHAGSPLSEAGGDLAPVAAGAAAGSVCP